MPDTPTRTATPGGSGNNRENNDLTEQDILNATTLGDLYSHRTDLGYTAIDQNDRQTVPLANAADATMLVQQALAQSITIQQAISNVPYERYYDRYDYDLRMFREESIDELNDRLQGYIGGARSSLHSKYANNIANATIIIVQDIALKAFARSLPDEIATIVDTKEPETI